MTDRTEIACIIAEWWSLQKRKNKRKYDGSPFQVIDLIDTTISVEMVLKVDNVDPLEVSEDYSQLVIKGVMSGGPRIVKFESKMNLDDFIQVKKDKVEFKPVTLIQPQNNNCSSCHHEIIYKSGEENEKYKRDCNNFNVNAQDFFRKNCKFTMSKSAIVPVVDCPFWTKVKKQNK